MTPINTMAGPTPAIPAHGPSIETLHAGILLPESVLQSDWFAVLAAFVAINTVMYVTLAVSKILPRIRLHDLFPRRYTRAETRSIHPDTPEPGPMRREIRPEPG